MPEVKICDVTLRDGLQVVGRGHEIPLATRLNLFDALNRAGLPYIEVGSFVHPKIMPAMADTPELLARIGFDAPETEIAVLVPTVRYYEKLRDAAREQAIDPVDTVAIFVSASEHYSRLNTLMTIDAAMARAAEVAHRALDDGYQLRAYLSCSFRDVRDDEDRPMPEGDVVAACRRLAAMGCGNVALSDTSGTATPGDVDRVVRAVANELDVSQLAVHLHDRFGLGITNAHVAYQAGVRVFDASVGGIGGNKSSQKAVGNIATEELVALFDSLGVSTGVDRDALLDAGRVVYEIAASTDLPRPPSKILGHLMHEPEPAAAVSV